MKVNQNFKSTQLAFAAYIRDPQQNPMPVDVAESRMAMYRALFFNNIEGFLSGNFPVLRALLNDEQWLALTQDFYAKHPCHTPYFLQIPAEFLSYLQHERQGEDDFPFMLELAHYEWVEMALATSEEEVVTHDKNLNELLNHAIALSPLAWPLAYQYPVHKIGPDFLPLAASAQPTFIVVYRNALDDVNFIEITTLTYRMLELIQAQEAIITADCLQQLAVESQHPNPELIINAGLEILKTLAEKTIITLV
ncbi:MAG: putative DNA-binding domain-containing protein [Methylococcales bacterium]|nr:putative DNA-binding domain-containing protein [Methylococcales bacterium]